MLARIDTLSITNSLPRNPADVEDAESLGLALVVDLLRWEGLQLRAVPARVNGYTHTFRLTWGGEDVGHMALGGNANSIGQEGVQIYLNALGCVSYAHGFESLADRAEAARWRMTRVDIAVDVECPRWGVDRAVAEWQAGSFKQAAGGRQPRLGQVGNWIEPDGTGRTVYVGSRQSDRMLRVYEKGLQLGEGSADWVRWELERKRDKYDISWTALRDPEAYFAASYPLLARMVSVLSRRGLLMASREVAKRKAKAAYRHLCEHAARSYGKLLRTIDELGRDALEELRPWIRKGMPARLVVASLPPAVIRGETSAMVGAVV
jgi:DNA relaxase NicK